MLAGRFLALSIILALGLAGCASLRNSPEMTRPFPRWDKIEIAEVALLAGLTITDGIGSTQCINPGPGGRRETDPMMNALWGRYPTPAQFGLTFGIQTLVILGVAEVLPSWWRKLLLAGEIANEGARGVLNNYINGCM